MTCGKLNDPTSHLPKDQREFVNSMFLRNSPLTQEEFNALKIIADREAAGNPVTLGEIVEGVQEVANRPTSVDIWCPICGNAVTVSVVWQTETGEFGSILAEWPELSEDPNDYDSQDHCTCDFKATLAKATADYWNDDDRLYSHMYPTGGYASLEGEKDDADLVFEWTQRVRDPWLCLKRMINVYEAARSYRNSPRGDQRKLATLRIMDAIDEVDDETIRALRDLVDILSPSSRKET